MCSKEMKRKEFIERQKEDAERLLEVQRKRQTEVFITSLAIASHLFIQKEEEERRLSAEKAVERQSQESILSR